MCSHEPVVPVSSTPPPARLLSFLVLPVSAGVGILSACLRGCLGPLLGVRCWGGAGFRSSDTCPLFDSQQSPSPAGGRTSLRRGCCTGQAVPPIPLRPGQYWLLQTWVGQEEQEGRGLEWWVMTGWMRH